MANTRKRKQAGQAPEAGGVAVQTRRRKQAQVEEDAAAQHVDVADKQQEATMQEQQEQQHAHTGDEVPDGEQQLDDFKVLPELMTALEQLKQQADDPTNFLQASTRISEAARHAAKALFSYTSASRAPAASQQQQQQPEQQLHVDSAFDVEQIWLQLELQLAPLLRQTHKHLKRLGGPAPRLVPEHVEQQIDAVLEGSSEEQDEDEEYDDEDEEQLEEQEEQDGTAGRAAAKRPAKKAKLLPAEDRFMRLEDMERFVQQAEAEAAGEDYDEGAAEFGASGSEDEEAALDDLLAGSAKLVGREGKSSKERQQHKGKRTPGLAAPGDESDDEGVGDDEGDDAMYKDFFGEEQQEEQQEEEEAGSDEGEDEEDGEGAFGAAFDDEEGEDGMVRDPDGGWRARRLPQRSQAAALGELQQGAAGSRGADEEEEETTLTTHQRRLMRMQERVRELEEAALGDKPWHMKGEVDAASRPLNSALELDMDYDTTARPPPAPTEEATQDLEELIRRRVADHRFDDVVRIAPPPPEKTKKSLELDENKAQVGLGELYEKEYVRQAAGGVAEDKAEPVRRAAVALFKTLCAKLDALSRFHFAPKPVVEELEVRNDVAAVLMEEVAPLAVSKASMQTPKEAYNPEAAGAVRAEGELTREDRKARRRRKKSAGAAKARPETTAGDKGVAGRKSLQAALQSGKLQKGVGRKHGRTDVGTSGAVFARIQQERDAAAGGGALGKGGSKKGPAADGTGISSARLKL